MQQTNPAIIPRNHRVEEALSAAISGEMDPFHRLLKALNNPYQVNEITKPFQALPPEEAKGYQTFCGT